MANQDDIVNRTDDTVRDFEAFVIFQLKELVVDLADYYLIYLLLINVNKNIFDFADKHALVRIDLKPEQLRNLGFHRYQMKVYT